MDKLTGCPDEAVLALAEVAALAQWKQTELQRGSLSMRDLIRRGDLIEQALRQSPLRSVTSSPVTETGPILPSGMASAAGMFPTFEMSPADDASRRAIPQIWRETAVLYLHTVLSDSHPGKLRCCPIRRREPHVLIQSCVRAQASPRSPSPSVR